MVYYRLKQIDNNEESELSDAILVSFSSVFKPASIFPNPTGGNLNIEWDETTNPFTVNIYNHLGRKVLTQIIVSDQEKKLDITSLSAGIYTLQLMSGTAKQTHIIFKE